MAADVNRPQHLKSKRRARNANNDHHFSVAATVRSRSRSSSVSGRSCRDLTIAATKRPVSSGAAFWLAAVSLVLLSGCTAAHHERVADKETYRIVQQAEAGIFGHTNAFTIETPYSVRKPKEIPFAELMEDRLATNRRVLKLEDALDLAFSRSRRYQAEKERLYLTALGLAGSRYQFSPQFLATVGGAFTRNSEGEQLTDGGAQVSVSQMLQTGGRLSASLANDILRYYTGDPRRSILSTLSVNLVQPVLRGFGRNNAAVENLTQSQRNVIYAVRDHAFFKDDFALEIVTDYFDLLAQKDIIRNRYANYLSRGQATKRLEARADREQLTAVDQTRQAELSALNNYVNSASLYFTTLDQFKIKLGLPLGERLYLDDDALDEVHRTGLVPVPLDPTAAYRSAVAKQLTLLNAIDRFEDSKRKVRVSADALRPGLDLFADASLVSDAPTDYTKFNANRVRASVGVELDLPIDRVPERNDYRATRVAFEAELRDLTLSLDTLKDNIERGMRTLEQRRQNYTIQTNALSLANRRVASITLLLQAGRAEARDLIEAQDAQVSAQNAVTAALVDYQQDRLQLMLNLGALRTDGEKFWLRDHLAGFLPAPPQTQVPTMTVGQQVLPPDKLFEQ